MNIMNRQLYDMVAGKPQFLECVEVENTTAQNMKKIIMYKIQNYS